MQRSAHRFVEPVVGVRLPSPTPMSPDFDILSTLKTEYKNRLSSRGLETDIEKKLSQAKSLRDDYQRRWDQASAKGLPKPDQTLALNQAFRLLRSVQPLTERISKTRQQLADQISEEYGFSRDLPEDIRLAVGAILECDRFSPAGLNPDRTTILRQIQSGLVKNQKVELFTFACPEIDSAYLTGPDPDYFIQTSASRNNISVNTKAILKLAQNLGAADIPWELTIIVGEEDEENYLFPVLGNFGTNPQFLKQRRSEYLESFREQCRKLLKEIPQKILGWTQLKPPSPSSLSGLNPSLINQEASRMTEFFQPGSYYGSLPQPTETQLRQIAQLKVATYGFQGVTIKTTLPNTVGLQSEQPVDLRTDMLNSALPEQEKLPFIYPFNPKKQPW